MNNNYGRIVYVFYVYCTIIKPCNSNHKRLINLVYKLIYVFILRKET